MKPSVTAAAGCDIPGLLVRGIQGNRTNKRHFISISIYLSISISICLFIYMLAVGLVTNSCLTLVTPQTVARQAPLPMGFSRQGYWSGLPFPAPGDLPDPGIRPGSPALQADSLLTEPPGKPKNTGVESQSLLQGIFLTQESDQGLLHCRRILYQLSHQGSSKSLIANPDF